MTTAGALYDFRHHLAGDGLHSYVSEWTPESRPRPAWPGLWQLDYPDGPGNPLLTYGVNNAAGEAEALWRALAWHVTAGTRRSAIPAWDRDGAARCLDVPRSEISLVHWEYEVSVEESDLAVADRGFRPARSCVPGNADAWHRAHDDKAGLFSLETLDQLTEVELAVAFAQSSEINLSEAGPGAGDLQGFLSSAAQPQLRDWLKPGSVFVDLSVDRGGPHTSRVLIRSAESLDERLSSVVEAQQTAYDRYLSRLGDVQTFADFSAAMDRLLAAGAGSTGAVEGPGQPAPRRSGAGGQTAGRPSTGDFVAAQEG